eukprot:2493276-Rhodomonas_salina.1
MSHAILETFVQSCFCPTAAICSSESSHGPLTPNHTSELLALNYAAHAHSSERVASNAQLPQRCVPSSAHRSHHECIAISDESYCFKSQGDRDVECKHVRLEREKSEVPVGV